MRIAYTEIALKQLKRIHSDHARQIRMKIEQYAADPASLRNQVIAVKGSELLRLRVGDYRVLFSEDGIVMLIEKIGHRRDVYDR